MLISCSSIALLRPEDSQQQRKRRRPSQVVAVHEYHVSFAKIIHSLFVNNFIEYQVCYIYGSSNLDT